MDVFGREQHLSEGELQRQGETAQASRAEHDRLQAIEVAARRFALAVPYYHELVDYVEYEVAYHELCLTLGIQPEKLDG